MKLEDQVCSLGLSKKLKDIGIEQDSLFYYLNIDGGGIFYIYYNESLPEGFEYEGDPISAFTVSELGKILQSHPKLRMGYTTVIDIDSFIFSDSNDLTSIRDENEANARAKWILYLLGEK